MRRSNARKHDPKINGGDADMDSLKLQYRPKAPHRSANLFSHHHRNSKQTAKSNLVLIASGTLTIALLYYIFVFSTSYRNSLKRKYGIVIDGGSTGSRIHVFSYEMRNGLPVFDFGENGLVSMRASPGLSSYAEDPDSAGGTVAELLDFAKKWIPKQHWGETEIQLMATAGMRLLEKEIQARILDSCRRVMRSSGFKFQDKWASVISGSDEGIYAWVVANYALGALGGDPQKTTGIIELGGASAQVTFVSSEPVPREFSHRIKFGNFTYVLYSHSLLHFGQNVAFDVLRESLLTSGQELDTDSLQKGKPVDPCTPKGYTHDTESRKLSPTSLAEKSRYLSTLHPAGNFSLCRTASLMLLQKGNEMLVQTLPHRIDVHTQAPGKFLATENFFHTSKFFGLSPSTFLAELMVAGQIFCEEDWSILRRKYHALDEEDLLRYCFSSAYIVAMLHDSLGIALDDARIEYANQVKNIPLDWALGAFISQTAANIESETETDDGSNSIANVVDSSTLLALVCISLVLIFTAWYFSKWRKPQLKTIYDLEKVLDISHLRQDKPRVHLQLHGRPRRRQDQTALRQTKPENAELIKSETQIFREREESSFPHCSFRQSKTITRISFLPFSLIQVFVGYCVVRMSDHLVVFMDRLVTPPATSDPAEDSGVSGSSGSAGPSSSSPPVGDKAARAAEEDQNDDPDEESPLIAAAECRICQEEDSVKNLETPCACSGSLKYAHRKCVQHWCNEKGDITCEICHQPYQPGYIAPPPRPQAEETTIDIGGGWQISGTPLDLNDPRFLAIAEAERQLLEAEYDDYNATNASGAAFCRSAALILMALLLLRHALTITDTDDEDASTFFSLFLLRAAGFLLPCYIMAWAISILQRRRQRQEAAALAAAQFAFVVQSGQNRGLQFTIASAAPPPTATQQQEEHV